MENRAPQGTSVITGSSGGVYHRAGSRRTRRRMMTKGEAHSPFSKFSAPEMSARQSDPLAALNALSYEEKIALFT